MHPATYTQQGFSRRDSSRIEYLDGARGTLMVLGVVYHAAAVYMTEPWRVHDPVGHRFFDWFVACVHTFRMPAFFFIAGYFAALSLQRLSTREFLIQRSTRLLLPLMATAITFNVLQHWLELWLIRNPHAPRDFIGHLWFLIDLLILTTLGTLVLALRPGTFSKLNAIVTRLPGPLALLSVLSVGSAIVSNLVLLWHGPSRVELGELGLVTSVDRLVAQMPYFLAGLASQRLPSLLHLFERISPIWLLPAAAGSAILSNLPPSNISWTLILSVHNFLSWIAVAAAISTFRLVFSKPSKFIRWLAESSYPVYLAHVVFVVGFGAYLTTMPWRASEKFLVLSTMSLASSFAFAHLVSKTDLLSFLYTGRRIKMSPSRIPQHTD